MDSRVKILPAGRAAAELQGLVANGLVAAAAGRFDILQAEHARRLEQAKASARALVVFVYADRPGEKPVLNAAARAQMVAALACVDRVVICDEAETDSLAASCDLPSVQRVEQAFPRDIVADVLDIYSSG
jgi:bifunctional ADP-heptose synthase (sugar kinase/adenylyltransferase)